MIAVVTIEEGVAVVAETVADAQRGLRALTVEWDDSRRRAPQLGGAAGRARPAAGIGRAGGRRSRRRRRAKRCSRTPPTVIDAMYTLPYLAHATMEPNNAACRMREDGVLEVWASTESPEYTRMAASDAAGIDKDQVEVHVTFAGGSFGLHSSSGARSDRRGRARRAGARLEAPDQGPVAARGGFQDRPLPRDGRAPRARRQPTRTVG